MTLQATWSGLWHWVCRSQMWARINDSPYYFCARCSKNVHMDDEFEYGTQAEVAS